MTSVSPRLLEFQLRLLALNGALEVVREPKWDACFPGLDKVLRTTVATEVFDIDAVQSLDFLLADHAQHQ